MWYEIGDSHLWSTTGNLSNDDDDASENVAEKMNLRPFKLFCVSLNPFNLSNIGEFSWSWILKDLNQVPKEKGKFVVVCSCPRSRAMNVKEMYCKAWCTCRAVALLIKLIAFWRCRRCACLSSPIREMQRKVMFIAKETKASSHTNEFLQRLLILLCRPKVQSLEAIPPDSQSKALPSVERQTQGPQGDSTFLTQQDVDASSLPAALPPVTSAQASAAGAVSSWSKETIVF